MNRVPGFGDRSVRLFVPGRIEVLGKHTDYAGGRSLLAATVRGFTVTVTTTDDDAVTVVDTVRGETVAIPLPGSAGDLAPEPATAAVAGPQPASAADAEPSWTVYPRTVVHRVARDFPGRLAGCRIDLSSDLPPAAGLSSSSAFITAIFLALDAAFAISETEPYRGAIGGPPLAYASADTGVDADTDADGARPRYREALAGYLGAVERGSPFPELDAADEPRGGIGGVGIGGVGTRGVGTRGGSEDHVAMLCAEPARMVRYAFEPVRREGVVPMPADHTFVIAASGVRAEKTGGARDRYNRLSDRAARAAALWRSATGGDQPHLGAILDAPDGYARLRDVITDAAPADERDDLLRRVRHFAAESRSNLPGAAEALAAGDLDRFGDLVDRSQAMAEKLLRNQVPETVYLARSARQLGAAAATAFGAGFGGSVWALVPISDAVVFLDDWRARYLDAFPDRAADASFFTSPAGAPARTL